MEDIKLIQERIRQSRETYAKADIAYYQALQEWSLSQRGIPTGSGNTPSPEEVENKRTLRTQALAALQAEIHSLYTEEKPQQLIEHLPSDVPFLLFPVRVEARYLTIRHVVRNLKLEDTIDISNNARLEAQFRTMGFKKDEEGVMTYEVPSFHLHGIPSAPLFLHPQEFEAAKPRSGNFIKRKNDKRELRIRLYPDDIFLEGLEQALQPEERNAGIQYWQKVCGGSDRKEEWMSIAGAFTPARTAWIIRATRPRNFSPGQPLPATPEFDASQILKDGAYTYPPITRLLPDKFVVRLFKSGTIKDFVGNVIPEPLLLGLDPTHDPFNTDKTSGMAQKGSSIQTPEYLRWVHDFEEAEKLGVGIRIDLDLHPEFKEGVDKILVTGVKLSANEAESTRLLEQLLTNHLYKEEGLSIVPKGTATNNFETEKPVINKREQEATLYFLSEWQQPPPGSLEKDESRLTKALGLNTDIHFPFGHCTDISEGALMNELLWPATWGYYLLQFFTPDLDEATRERLRQFFIKHVSARGILPVLRVNRQPYGILPVSSFSHWVYANPDQDPEEQLASQAYAQFLRRLNNHWQDVAANVLSVNTLGSQGASDKFFDMLEMSPSAAKLQRQWLAGIHLQQAMKASQEDPNANTELTSDPGFKPGVVERELSRVGMNAAFFKSLTGAYSTPRQQVRRILIDGLPLADDRTLEKITGKDWNYLQWLAQARLMDIWNHDFTAVPAGEGDPVSSASVSAFAVLARQAVLRAFLEEGMRIAETQPGLWLLKVKDFETQYLHKTTLAVNPAALSGANILHQAFKPIMDKFALNQPFEVEPDRRVYFTRTYAATSTQNLSEWIDANKKTATVPLLKGVMSALDYFSQVPTKRLDNLFAEHLDLCSHRLDAWLGGLLSQRLFRQRRQKPQGIYLGSFGYLLGLKPNQTPAVVFVEQAPEYIPATFADSNAAAIPVIHTAAASQNGLDLSSNGLERAYFYIGDTLNPGAQLNTHTGQIEPDPSVNKSQSDGFIHAPSTTHATAAAILRNGYLNHQADDQTALLAIQLNSPRIRQALGLLEGMQQGVSLGELLGYYFERLLHEATMDRVLLNLRLAFPVKRTEDGSNSPSAMTSIDGLELLQNRREKPAVWLNSIQGVTTNDHGQLNQLAQTLENYLDSLGDMLLAESVYQMAKGNKERAAAALRMMNSGGQVVLPEFVRTPMRGHTITHRIGIIFQQLPGTPQAGWTPSGSPRSRLSPELNHWLTRVLPAPATIAIVLSLPDGRAEKITLSEMSIEPLDLLYAMPDSFAEAETSSLAHYVLLAAQQKFNLAATQPVNIHFNNRSKLTPSDVSIFELSSLVRALRKMLSESRPLSANDFLLPDQQAAASEKTNITRLKSAFVQQVLSSSQVREISQILRTQAAALDAAISQEQAEAGLQSILKTLQGALLAAWQQGVETSTMAGVALSDKDSIRQLSTKAVQVATELENRLSKATGLLTEIPDTALGEPVFRTLQEVASSLFGPTLLLFPDVELENTAAVSTCFNNQQLIENTGADAIDEWMLEAALVRKPLRSYRQAMLLSETLSPAAVLPAYAVLQFPFLPGRKQAWVGGIVPDNSPPDERASLSLVLDLPPAFDPSTPFSGFVIDEWPEWIPEKVADTGVAFQYNQPNTEPPQTMLLAVAPDERGNWIWEHVVGAVNEALEMSKKRLLTPEQIRDSNPGLNQVLPAIVLPFTPENKQTPVVEPL